MIVLKFGGTSVGTPARMSDVAKLVLDRHPAFVVLSAISGVTNKLEEIAGKVLSSDNKTALRYTDELKLFHLKFIAELFSDSEALDPLHDSVEEIFRQYLYCEIDKREDVSEKRILSAGEKLSTAIFYHYVLQMNGDITLLDACSIFRTDAAGEPDISFIKKTLNKVIAKNPSSTYITQGFLCTNHLGRVDNLKRGGSDFSATIAGAVIDAEEIQIWTDVNGMCQVDPRIIPAAKPIEHLHFDEAAELAYFGARILHPSCIRPAKDMDIPVLLKNTLNPEAPGTVIDHEDVADPGIKAIAAKGGITAIRINSGRMLMAYGFLRSVFEVFEHYKCPIDMITTSEVSVSLTVDDTTFLNEIEAELKRFASVEVAKNLTIISLVGKLLAEQPGLVRCVFDALESVAIRMVCYGGSSHNISLLVSSEDSIRAQKHLYRELFASKEIYLV